jgi:hypothetical protein
MELVEVGSDNDDSRVFGRIFLQVMGQSPKGIKKMKDEERKVEAECEACKGSGYLCECEADEKVNRSGDEECEYCSSQRRDKHKYVCNYCEGEGKAEEVEHVAVEG